MQIYGYGKPNDKSLPKNHSDFQTSKGIIKHQECLDMGSYPRRLLHQAKEEISSPRVLALYDPSAKTKISADAALLVSHVKSLRTETMYNRFYDHTVEESSFLTEEPKLPRISGIARPGPTRACALPSTFQALPSAAQQIYVIP